MSVDPVDPRFGVIIPVYNGADYLAETIESVLAQTYPASEIFVIDDGSRDQSADIARRYAPRVNVITKPNSGVSATRNLGVSRSTADWLAFLDADDIWERDHLAIAAQVIRAHPDSDVVYSGRRRLVQQGHSKIFTLTEPEIPPAAHLMPAVLMERCPCGPSSFIVRRSSFLETGGFRGSVEDWDLLLRLSRRGARFTLNPEPTVRYRVHTASTTNNPIPVLKKSIDVVRANITPNLPPAKRAVITARIISRLEAEAAILLRENGQPGALRLMLRSIARHPFHEPRRYKIALNMLLKGTKRAHKP